MGNERLCVFKVTANIQQANMCPNSIWIMGSTMYQHNSALFGYDHQCDHGLQKICKCCPEGRVDHGIHPLSGSIQICTATEGNHEIYCRPPTSPEIPENY